MRATNFGGGTCGCSGGVAWLLSDEVCFGVWGKILGFGGRTVAMQRHQERGTVWRMVTMQPDRRVARGNLLTPPPIITSWAGYNGALPFGLGEVVWGGVGRGG